MIDFLTAFDTLVRQQPVLTTEKRSIDACVGYVLAGAVRARRSQPAAAMSAMDGYAVSSAEIKGGRTQLPLASDIAAAGAPAFALPNGMAARIFTGGLVPEGADQIVIQEDVSVEDGTISFAVPAAKGQHIRTASIDFGEGDMVMEAGTYLSPKMVGLLASAGAGHVMVHRAPHVDIFATGDELTSASADRFDAHQTVNSNGPMIAGLLREAGATVTDHGILPDTPDAITNALAGAKGDIVLTIGGASVGEHDYVGDAFEKIGVTRDFWKVAMRPGKPLFVGQKDGRRYIGLPGNPVSAFITAFLFVRPLVDQMMGRPVPDPAGIPLPSAVDLPANGSRTHFMRARLIGDIGSRHVDPAAEQDSSLVSVLAASDGLLIREAGAPAAPAGTLVPYMPF